MAKPPVHEIRFGSIKAVIWSSQTKVGQRHTVTLVRLFRDGDRWRESTRFGRDDLLLAAKALNEAHSWIYRTSDSQRPESYQHEQQ